MANSNVSGDYKEVAVIDTAPVSAGFWTVPISMRKQGIAYMFMSIRGTGTATVTLQFRCDGDSAWTDFYNDGNAFAVGDHKLIEGNAAGTYWRVGVKSGGLSTGSVTIGFNW